MQFTALRNSTAVEEAERPITAASCSSYTAPALDSAHWCAALCYSSTRLVYHSWSRLQRRQRAAAQPISADSLLREGGLPVGPHGCRGVIGMLKAHQHRTAAAAGHDTNPLEKGGAATSSPGQCGSSSTACSPPTCCLMHLTQYLKEMEGGNTVAITAGASDSHHRIEAAARLPHSSPVGSRMNSMAAFSDDRASSNHMQELLSPSSSFSSSMERLAALMRHLRGRQRFQQENVCVTLASGGTSGAALQPCCASAPCTLQYHSSDGELKQPSHSCEPLGCDRRAGDTRVCLRSVNSTVTTGDTSMTTVVTTGTTSSSSLPSVTPEERLSTDGRHITLVSSSLYSVADARMVTAAMPETQSLVSSCCEDEVESVASAGSGEQDDEQREEEADDAGDDDAGAVIRERDGEGKEAGPQGESSDRSAEAEATSGRRGPRSDRREGSAEDDEDDHRPPAKKTHSEAACSSKAGATASDVASRGLTARREGFSPFGAPLPCTEPPPHGRPRPPGATGARGEMTIGAFLGGGACGRVYECLNTESGEVLAVKQIVYHAKDSRLKQQLHQLAVELEVMELSVDYPDCGIVRFFCVEKRGHTILLYMEYCSHGSLLDYMVLSPCPPQPSAPAAAAAATTTNSSTNTSPISLACLKQFTRSITEAIHFLHTHLYAHLDVKTANVLLTHRKICKLADFGCAARLTRIADCPYPVVADREHLTELRGTALYMAPEMVRLEAKSIGSAADIWSLGCVVMEMATGESPWTHLGAGKMGVLYQLAAATERVSLPDGMDEVAKDFVRQCTTINPAERPSAEQLLQHPLLQW